MDRQAIDLVLATLPKGRTVFYDFEDRYALLLLSHHLQHGPMPIEALKRSHLAPLLNKPLIKSVIAQLGRGWIEVADLFSGWPQELDAYRLTLDSWPSLSQKPQRVRHQVTRNEFSLVLQLNLPMAHQRELNQTIGNWHDYTSAGFHPVAKSAELTLAWARIDIDFATGEALIEELQSDWVRDVRYYARSKWMQNQAAWESYYSDYLEPRAKHWPRTMLAATLWLLLEELGIKTIFYHTYESGVQLKQIKYGAPPRSIYTDTPRTFCFRTTYNGPAFLRDSQDKHVKKLFSDPATKWFVHSF